MMHLHRHLHYWYCGGPVDGCRPGALMALHRVVPGTDRALIGSIHRWTGHAEIQSANWKGAHGHTMNRTLEMSGVSDTYNMSADRRATSPRRHWCLSPTASFTSNFCNLWMYQVLYSWNDCDIQRSGLFFLFYLHVREDFFPGWNNLGEGYWS